MSGGGAAVVTGSRPTQYILIKECQGLAGLIETRAGYPHAITQILEKELAIFIGQCIRILQIGEQHESGDPVKVGLL